MPLVLTYYQPDDVAREGVLVLGGEIFRTTGRLDAVGSRVFAWGFAPGGAEGNALRLAVQCERTSATTLAAEITGFGAGGAILLKHRVDGVPITTVGRPNESLPR